MTRRPRALLVAAAVVAVAAAGCGLPEDDRPRIIAADEAPFALGPSPEAASNGQGSSNAQLYLVNELGQLTIVLRPVSVDNLQQAMRALLAGPTAEDGARQLSTSIPPDTVLLDANVDEVGIATINLGPAEGGVRSVAGEEQRKAFAQIVLTAVEVEGVQSVLFQVDGTPVEAPTGGIPTGAPVTRADYAALDPTIVATTVPVAGTGTTALSGATGQG